MVALWTETVHDIFVTPAQTSALMERQQFWVLHIGYSRHRTDTWVQKRTIDRCYRQKYNKLQRKHEFQHNRYRKLQNMQHKIIGCWLSHFDIILLLKSNKKSIIWIYRWTRWQPTQFRWVGRFPLNCTQIDGLGVLTTQNTNLAMVRFWPGTRPERTVRCHC